VLIIGVYNVTKKSYQEVTNGVTQDASKHGGAAVAGDLMVFPPLAQGYIGLLDISGDISAWVYETFDITTFGIARSSKFLDAAAVGNKVINHPQQPSATQWSLHPTRPHLCGQSQWDREEALWFFGELGDSCDDLCEFKGYAGCDEVETAKLTTRPRISRLMMMGLNSSCSSHSDSGTSNSPAYNPSTGQCHRISGQASCANTVAATLQPIAAGHWGNRRQLQQHVHEQRPLPVRRVQDGGDLQEREGQACVRQPELHVQWSQPVEQRPCIPAQQQPVLLLEQHELAELRKQPTRRCAAPVLLPSVTPKRSRPATSVQASTPVG